MRLGSYGQSVGGGRCGLEKVAWNAQRRGRCGLESGDAVAPGKCSQVWVSEALCEKGGLCVFGMRMAAVDRDLQKNFLTTLEGL